MQERRHKRVQNLSYNVIRKTFFYERVTSLLSLHWTRFVAHDKEDLQSVGIHDKLRFQPRFGCFYVLL